MSAAVSGEVNITYAIYCMVLYGNYGNELIECNL